MHTIREDAKKVGVGRKAIHDLFYYCSINKLIIIVVLIIVNKFS